MLRKETLKDHFKERQIFLNRTIIVLMLMALAFMGLFSRLIYLQVLKHNKFSYLAKNNQVRIVPKPSVRGVIYDRNGNLLAKNIPTHSLEITRNQVTDLDTTIAELQKIIDITDDDISSFKKQLKYKNRYESVPLRQNLSELEISKFSNAKYRFPGVDVAASLTRYYPYGHYTAHILGYMGPITDKELSKRHPAKYRGANFMGKAGLEYSLESELCGEVGYEHIETDARGRSIRTLQTNSPLPGKNITLSIDIDLQKKILDEMSNTTGAVVAISPKTGEILALVSSPSFNPNIFNNDRSSIEIDRVFKDPKNPMFNRAINGQYPPGSTIKPILSLWALEKGYIKNNSMIYDPGYYRIAQESKVFRDWKRDGHGWVDVQKAIRESCTTFFYHLSQLLEIEEINKCFTAFGFGKEINIGLPNVATGIAPSKEWKQQNKNEIWFPGETLNVGIGQGYTLVTPLQSALMTAIIANKGKIPKPVLIIDKGKDDAPANSNEEVQDAIFPNSKHWNSIINSMEEVVRHNKGTAYKINRKIKYPIAGKTGTAQVHTITERIPYNQIPVHLRDHSWFIAFSPVKDPDIALAVILEHDRGSAALAAKIVNYYSELQANNRL